jgi:hypothetical protein
MNARGGVPLEACKERSGVGFGGFRPLKHVEEPGALAREAPLLLLRVRGTCAAENNEVSGIRLSYSEYGKKEVRETEKYKAFVELKQIKRNF